MQPLPQRPDCPRLRLSLSVVPFYPRAVAPRLRLPASLHHPGGNDCRILIPLRMVLSTPL